VLLAAFESEDVLIHLPQGLDLGGRAERRQALRLRH
jgi:hypothetical protein